VARIESLEAAREFLASNPGIWPHVLAAATCVVPLHEAAADWREWITADDFKLVCAAAFELREEIENRVKGRR
jgi:hypothetical protein